VTILPILIYGMVRLVIKYCRARKEKMMGKDLDFEAQKFDWAVALFWSAKGLVVTIVGGIFDLY